MTWLTKRLNISKRILSGIRFRILLIAIIPLLLCATILTSITIYLRTHDSEINLQNFANTTIENLSRSAEFGLYSGNISTLRRLSEVPLKNEFISGVLFYDTDKNLLLNSGNIKIPENLITRNDANVIEHNALLYYIKQVVIVDDDLMDQDLSSNTTSKPIGWVVIALTREPLTLLHQNILLTSFFAFLGSFTISWILSNQLGRSISRPIYQIADVVSNMESGALQTRVPEIGTHETRILAGALNRLANSVELTNSQLQSRIEQATSELQQTTIDLATRNTELEGIRIDLENALTAKDAFLARMSHELRTPLTSVLGFNRLLEATPLSSQQQQYTRNIDQASVLLLSTIEDILDFSKIESGVMRLEEIDFDLEQTVEDLIALQACNVYNKDIELVLLIDSDVPTHLNGDPVRVKQIINNLLSNAIKFTENGEVILRISVTEINTENVNLTFMIKDTGIGIERKNLHKLFQPFHQADNTISRRFGGTGLGLAICQQLVDLMGGDIFIESEVGEGTEVYFSLKFLLSDNTDYAKEIRNDILDPNLSTLIIDSMPWSRRALRNNLSLWMSNIFAVPTPKQALPLFKNHAQFGLVVLSLKNNQLDENSTNSILSTLRTAYSGPILILVGSVDFEYNVFQSIQQQYAPLYLLAKPAKRLQLQEAISSIYAFASNEVRAISKTSEKTSSCLEGMRILVVEDNSFNQQLIQTIISLHGGETQSAYNGEEAFDIYTRNTFDVIIIDMHMPVMNGIDTIKKIREIANDNIVIIGLTADLNTRNFQQMYAVGANKVLSKPIDEQALVANLAELNSKNLQEIYSSNSILASHHSTSKRALISELEHLHAVLCDDFQHKDIDACRNAIHQLLGLAGLYGMNDIKQLVNDIQKNFINEQFIHPHEKIAQLGQLINQYSNIEHDQNG